jgi:AcrR family transcriptional regulator
VALRHLAERGLAGLSVAAVAQEAGTSRPAVYRRWATKEELAIAAVASLAAGTPPEVTGDPFPDLVAELEHFRHCIMAAHSLPLVGVMLADGTSEEIRAQYREGLVQPRRSRLQACLQAGVDSGALAADADLDIAGSLMTGSWYALALAGRPAPDDWAPRVARAVWRACGGTPAN